MRKADPAILVRLLVLVTLGATGLVGCSGQPHHELGAAAEPSLAPLLFARHELPPGCALLPDDVQAPFPNPTLSTDREFVDSFVSMLSEGSADPADVEEVLFSVYVEDAEVGLFAFRLSSAELMTSFQARLAVLEEAPDRSRTYVANEIVAWLWHDGVSPACWNSMQQLVAAKLAAGSQ